MNQEENRHIDVHRVLACKTKLFSLILGEMGEKNTH